MQAVSCEILDGKELLNEQSGFLSPLYIPYEEIMLVTSLQNIVTQNLKVSHPRCVVKIQVREENPILYKIGFSSRACIL